MHLDLNKILRSRGLRVSLAGAVVFVIGLASLLVLPVGLAIILILGGGMFVWGGFLWTIFSFYTTPPPDDEQAAPAPPRSRAAR